ncbi:MAG: undecaprenyl-diphosphate phosphatase [Acidobacteria bacterium]|nr:undecaprenyl-diphosphate phosphatase [Acidobacteriota bacterium]MCG3192017.1 Undecaprenyl-diphosphatase [Thermoanaerobaculia bacterium]MCK6684990.1 undecaprenyl-diphosphate phosphatase [Thermoanaerobaculia bacterium]
MSITLWQAILLGFVQGLTEFLPVSSTAHLALVQRLLPGFSQPGILFDVMLHVGTLFAVVYHFRARLIELLSGLFSTELPKRRFAWRLLLALCLAVALTGSIALPLKKLAVEGMENVRAMGFALMGTAVLLSFTQSVGRKRGEDGGRDIHDLTFRDAAVVGFFQAFSAIFHGFSRSGNTISVGLFCGLSRRAAAEFSFLLSVPTILSAAVVENISAYRHHELSLYGSESWMAYAVGMVTAAVVGYLAISLLLKLFVAMRLYPFIIYCGTLGIYLVLSS